MHFIVTAIVSLLLFACEPANSDASLKNVKLISPKGDVVIVKVEVADDAMEHRQGLMYRKELAPNNGMIFIWPDKAIRSFWMKNTFIPLDMVFADGNDILGIIHNVQPHTEQGRSVNLAGNIVLEVNAGFMKKHGVNSNWRLEYEE